MACLNGRYSKPSGINSNTRVHLGHYRGDGLMVFLIEMVGTIAEHSVPLSKPCDLLSSEAVRPSGEEPPYWLLMTGCMDAAIDMVLLFTGLRAKATGYDVA